MKPGSLLAIVHKSSIWPKWEGEQDRLDENKAWTKIWMSEEPVRINLLSMVKYQLLTRIYIYVVETFALVNAYKFFQVPYLPSMDVQGTDKAKIYMYKKL